MPRAPKRSAEYWQDKVDEFKASGLTQKAFCQKHNVKLTSLKNWLYKLKSSSDFITLDAVKEADTPFIEIKIGHWLQVLIRC